MTPEQLRASILQYAMEGKLVKQNPDDEPAVTLLDKIKTEREELVKEGKLKKPRKVQSTEDEDFKFDIPNSWSWCRLGNIIYHLTDGAHKTPKYIDTKDGIPFLSVKDISSGKIDLTNTKFISQETHEVLSKRCNPQKGDILLTKVGTTGIPVIVDTDIKFDLFVSVALLKFDDKLIDAKYFKYLLESPLVQDQVCENTKGVGNKNWVLRDINNTLIVLPPLEEQKRIVAKIEKLMPLVDEYAESYNRLQKIDNEFEDKLKQSVLQYAMEGKLVKQNPSDEPASELIKKIENEKAELVKEGKIKKSKKLPAVTDDEKPFDIPDSWEWVRLKQITTYGNFNSIKGSSIPDNSWVVDMKDVRKNGGGFSEIVRRKSTNIYKSNKYSFNKNAVLYGKLRPYLRKVEIAQTSGFTTTEMLPINVVDLSTLVPQYLRYAMLSPYFVNSVNDSMYGMKMPRVGTTFLAKMVVPLPPLEEQKRIVEKVEELQSSISNLSK